MGGHSKGGNLAAYAAVCLPAKYRPIVKGVFSYDGPGFSNSFIADHAIDEMADRMYTFLPEGSTVGRMLEHAESYEVVKSTVSNLLQHDLYTWSVEPLQLERAEKSSDGSEIFYNSVRHLLEETTPRQRELVLDGVYSIVTANASPLPAAPDHVPGGLAGRHEGLPRLPRRLCAGAPGCRTVQV